ncbi:MAG: GNAT family N-acetyltransferase [Actinomycetota bacterium]
MTTAIRPAADADLPPLTALYNHYVRTSPATFDVDEFTVESRREWFGHYAPAGRHRLLVAVDEDGGIAGYATSSRYRPKAAYESSVETSVYVAHSATGQGVGTALYTALFDALAGLDVHRAFAGVTLPNDASVALHHRFGFRRVALFTEQGRKFGRYWDVAWFEKAL